jgi:serine/threonine-protein kinase
MLMTADAQSSSKLDHSSDELWLDDGSSATQQAFVEPPPTTRATCSNAGRYHANTVISGKYQLVEVLGEGGMGSVWVARNRTLDVDVALKLMRSELAEDKDGIAERMLQEARAAACIGHPAIIQVYDFGFTERGDPFIVMEQLRGESLAQALSRRRRVSPTRAVQTLLPIIDALAATHAQGIVHRDLKPANIFLARPAGQRLQPKVLDFGIAKLEQRAAGRLTQDGAVIGSPAYMSPEQFTGDGSIDGRADIWALCVVLYEMITGHRPFENDGQHAAVWWNVLNGKPRPISEHGVDDPVLWGILERGFSKDPSGRHTDMRALGRTLAEWLVSRGVQEDICNASLRAWLAHVDTGGQLLASFFPSKEPGANDSPRIIVDPLAQTIARSLESSGTRPIPLVVKRPASSAHSQSRLLWLAGLGALVAFSATAGFAAWSARSGTDKSESSGLTSPLRRAPEKMPATELARRAPPAVWPSNSRQRAYDRPVTDTAPVDVRSRVDRNQTSEPSNGVRARASDRALAPEPTVVDLRLREGNTSASSARVPRPAAAPAPHKKARELKNPFE